MFALELKTLVDLSRHLWSFVSLCTDMGTELGMAEFRSPLEGVVPHWFQPGPSLQPDTEVDDADDAGDPSSVSHPTWMPRSMTIPGSLHGLHNLSLEVDTSLQWWGVFYSWLKNISALLSCRQRRRRFIKSCLRSSQWRSSEALFQNDLPQLYEKRWGHVINFVAGARGALLIMRASWSEQLYKAPTSDNAGGDDEDPHGQFDARLLTSTLRSNRFFAYLDMILKLHKAIGKLGGWSEGCYCHEYLHKKTKPPRHIAAAVYNKNQNFDTFQAGGPGNRWWEDGSGFGFRSAGLGV